MFNSQSIFQCRFSNAFALLALSALIQSCSPSTQRSGHASTKSLSNTSAGAKAPVPTPGQTVSLSSSAPQLLGTYSYQGSECAEDLSTVGIPQSFVGSSWAITFGDSTVSYTANFSSGCSLVETYQITALNTKDSSIAGKHIGTVCYNDCAPAECTPTQATGLANSFVYKTNHPDKGNTDLSIEDVSGQAVDDQGNSCNPMSDLYTRISH